MFTCILGVLPFIFLFLFYSLFLQVNFTEMFWLGWITHFCLLHGAKIRFMVQNKTASLFFCWIFDC